MREAEVAGWQRKCYTAVHEYHVYIERLQEMRRQEVHCSSVRRYTSTMEGRKRGIGGPPRAEVHGSGGSAGVKRN